MSKTALVIGGTRGIGNVIASRFEATHTVIAVGRKWDGTLTARPSVVVFAQRWRGAPEDEWAGHLAVTLPPPYVMEALTAGASVIMIGSALASTIGTEQSAGYHVAKAGLIQLVRYYAVMLGPKGIRVNMISPGATVKPESEAFYAAHPEITDVYKQVCPLGRMGTANDVADLALFLASPQASYITGQNFVLDGGMSCLSQESLARSLSAAKDIPVTQR